MEMSESDTSGEMEVSIVNFRVEKSSGGGGGHAGEVGGGQDSRKKRKKDARDRSSSKKNRRPGRSPVRSSKKQKRPERSVSRGRDRKSHPKRTWTSARRSHSPVRGSPPFSPTRSRSPRRYHRRLRSRSMSRSPPRSRSPSDGIVCKDFDEQGVCLRGELCPYDHGIDPLVLRDTMSPEDTRVALLSLELNRRMPDGYESMRPNSSNLPSLMGEYNPDSPAIDSLASGCWWNPIFTPERFDCGPPFGPPHAFQPRELRSVPLMGMPEIQPERYRQAPSMGMHSQSLRGQFCGRGRGRGRGRGGFDQSRLGLTKPIRNYRNCGVEVKRIPREQNNINDLYAHFRKFGKITNIQINFEGDCAAALVTFSSPQEAQAALESTAPVMNNRFIRVFWPYNKDKGKENGGERKLLRFSIRNDAYEGEGGKEQEQIPNSSSTFNKTPYNPALLPLQSPSKNTEAPSDNTQAAAEARKKAEAQLAAEESLRQAHEKKNDGIVKLANGLRKRKQKLIVQQLEVQKRLISKLEGVEGSLWPEEKKSDVVNLIKSLDINIGNARNVLVEDKLRRQTMLANAMNAIAPAPAPPLPPPTVRVRTHSKEDVQKELLDAEMDLYNREQDEGDTQELQKKISELRAQAGMVGIRGGGTYWGSSRGGRGYACGRRGRGGGRGSRMAYRGFRDVGNIDRRSSEIIVTGFPSGRLPEILPHFSQFGVIMDYSHNPAVPSMTLNYDSRKSAESAMNNGTMFGESALDIKWTCGM